jgi:Flp pilus assembly protein TadD
MSRIEAIKALLDQDPEDPDLHLMLGAELRNDGRFAEAAEALRAYLGLVPPTADVGAAYRDLGICLDRLGQADQAAEAYREGIAAAIRHHHLGLQNEIEDLLKNLA